MTQTSVPMATAVSLRGVTKVYDTGAHRVAALRGVTLDFPPGTFTAVMGPSGSGKTTLLHCAAGLDRPTQGTITIGDTDIGRLDEAARSRLRRDRIGFVFQDFNLLASLTAEQNVALPLRLAGARVGDQAARALHRVGLADRAGHRPAQLSGGQRQRVAIARALVTRPAAIFADEPTGSLDRRTGREILDMLKTLVSMNGFTVVMVTHDPRGAAHADRVVFLADGIVVTHLVAPTPESVAAQLTRLEGE